MWGRSIQKSGGRREEAVLESVETCPETFVSFITEEGESEYVKGVWGPWLCWLFSEAARSVDSVNGWEAGLSDGLSFFHDPL